VAPVLSRPDSIRQRAQSAATISGAVTAALVLATVSVATRAEEGFKWWTIVLIGLALLGWLISVGLSIHAVSFGQHQERPSNFTHLVTSYETYADTLRTRLRTAALVSAGAMALSGLAVTAETAELMSSNEKRMRVLLTDEGAAVLHTLCGWGTHAEVNGDLPRNELAKSAVQIKNVKLDDTWCREAGRDVILPRKAIRGARED